MLSATEDQAFRALVDARYELVRIHAGLGEQATRLTLASPSDNVEFCRKHRVSSCTLADGTIYYNAGLVNSINPQQVLYLLAFMCVVKDYNEDMQAQIKLGTYSAQEMMIAANWLTVARVNKMKIGEKPPGVFHNDLVQADHDLLTAARIARQWIDDNVPHKFHVEAELG